MNISLNAIKCILILVLLTGCKMPWLAWVGYQEPTLDDFEQIPNCPIKIGTQNLNSLDRIAILEATEAVYLIFQSREFEDSVRARSWRITCKLENDQAVWLSGDAILDSIRQGYVDFSIYSHRPNSAIAQTHTSRKRVAIRPNQVRKWNSENILVRAELISTIAHESMHIISYSFKDSGHGKKGCLNRDLVSYGIGALVKKIWLSKQEH